MTEDDQTCGECQPWWTKRWAQVVAVCAAIVGIIGFLANWLSVWDFGSEFVSKFHQPIEVVILTEVPTVGEPFELQVTAKNKTVYVWAIQFPVEGPAMQLFPNEFQPDYRLVPGETVEIPSSDGIELRPGEPAGHEEIVLFASELPFPSLESTSNSSSSSSPYPTYARTSILNQEGLFVVQASRSASGKEAKIYTIRSPYYLHPKRNSSPSEEPSPTTAQLPLANQY